MATKLTQAVFGTGCADEGRVSANKKTTKVIVDFAISKLWKFKIKEPIINKYTKVILLEASYSSLSIILPQIIWFSMLFLKWKPMQITNILAKLSKIPLILTIQLFIAKNFVEEWKFDWKM